MNKPDLLIFLSDQHHAHYVGYRGHPLVRTPHLDRLAADGIVFEAAYTACPLCVPARTAFLTGQLPSMTGVYTNNGAIASDQATFLHSLAAEGYETVLCGRMHFMGEDQRHGFTRRIMGEITPLYWGVGGAARTDLGPYAGTMGTAGCLNIIGGGTSPVLEYDRAVVKAALAYLNEDHDKPQCLVVGTYAPHFTYVAPLPLYRYYRGQVACPEHNSRHTNYKHPLIGSGQSREKDASGEVMLNARAAYFGMIENLDEQIGEVRQAWEAYLQRRLRTGLFFYLSDHGDQAGEHHLYGKNTFYEGSVAIPLLVAGDGVRVGRRMRGAVSMLDMGPTLCEIVGASAPPLQAGRSLAKQLFEGADDPTRMVVSELLKQDRTNGFVPARMLRGSDWKLISYYQYEEHDLLFNLQEDPLETNNVRSLFPERWAVLRKELISDWNTPQIIETAKQKARHHQLLTQWGKSVRPEEKERWPVPEFARRMPES